MCFKGMILSVCSRPSFRAMHQEDILKNNIKNKVHLDRTSDFTISCMASVLDAYSYRPSGAGDHGCWAGSPAAPDVLVLSVDWSAGRWVWDQ